LSGTRCLPSNPRPPAGADCRYTTRCLSCRFPRLLCIHLPLPFTHDTANTSPASAAPCLNIFGQQGFCLASASGMDVALRQQIVTGCDLLLADANKSPALLRRPGAICNRLGICQTSCQVAAAGGPSTNGSLVTHQQVSMCSKTGLVAVPAEDLPSRAALYVQQGLKPDSCLSSAECASGLECDTFSQSSCFETCHPDTGLDR
jgi:hypothetical protein